MKDGKGYLVPDPPDPPDMVCVRIFIPNHLWYIAAFWGAYEFFTKWTAWARDPLKKGLVAAQAWKRAYEKSRENFRLTKGVCFDMIEDIRTDPLNPCVLQIKRDGVWVNIMDAACCGGGCSCGGGGSLRYAGGQIQRWDSDTQSWVPAGPTSPPDEIPNTPPPYTPSSDGACLAATNFGSLMEDRKNLFADRVGDGLRLGDLILEVFDWLILAGGAVGWLLSLAGQSLSFVYAAMGDQYADVAAYDIEDMAVCLAMPHYGNDGTMSQAQVDAFLTDIDAKIAEFDTTDPEATTWRFVYSFVKASGPNGMRVAATFKGITEGACASCPWTHTEVFGSGPGGYVTGNYNPDPDFNPAGYWNQGGWITQVKDNGGELVPSLNIKKMISPTTITKVRVRYFYIPDDLPSPLVSDGIYVQGVVIEQAPTTGLGETVYEFDPPIGVDQFALAVGLRDGGASHPHSALSIVQVTWWGTGNNPFVAPLPPVGG